VRANPAFVRGIAGNAFSCLCIASQNLGESIASEEGCNVLLPAHVPAASPDKHRTLPPATPNTLLSCSPALRSCFLPPPADDDKSYWNQVASKLAEATSADELMSYHKWMPGGQDAAQALLNADKVGWSWEGGLTVVYLCCPGFFQGPCCCPSWPPSLHTPRTQHIAVLACPSVPPSPAAELLLGPAHRAVAPAAPAHIQQ
jgi:hypothetical protein